jgi:hypothetical protein
MKAKRKPTPPPTRQRALDDARVWHARRYCGAVYTFVGFLISEPGKPERPEAFIFAEDDSREAEERAFEEVEQIADFPFLADTPRSGAVQFKPGQELPGWLYGLHVVPMLDDGGDTDEWDVRPLDPFCPIRLARMIEQAKEFGA